MSKTIQKKTRYCPVCLTPVRKINKYGQNTYDCVTHWGPWRDSLKSPDSKINLRGSPKESAVYISGRMFGEK